MRLASVMPPPPSESVAELSLFAVRERGRDEIAPVEQEVLVLFDTCGPSLLRYVASFGMDAEDAEDVVQDAFVALFHHLDRGRPRVNLRGWLFRVADNQARRRRHRRWASARRHAPEARIGIEPDPTLDPEARLIRRERTARARAILRALPERDRQCLQLRSHGLHYRDIAETLGVSLGTVAKSIARSISRFVHAEGAQRARGGNDQ
jgi:RNA polymerase sigma-70 factor (ECF subfamily)